ncbi:hypothetical protein O181_045351, partial [Austropuccinia psidii MF-1]|nr:hypothetical protein [Austropuccinia psidii MF-1]
MTLLSLQTISLSAFYSLVFSFLLKSFYSFFYFFSLSFNLFVTVDPVPLYLSHIIQLLVIHRL